MSVQPNPAQNDTNPEQTGIPNSPFPLKRIVGTLLAVALAFTAAAVLLPKSADAKDAIGLETKQKAQVVKLQEYLNAISTMRARFMQVTSQGNFAQGEFLLSRPGRMRIEYDPPVPVLIVSNGSMVMYKDKELDQLSYVPLSSLPASMFIGEKVNFFGDDLMITDFEQSKGVMRITLQRSEDPMEGSLSLVFQDRPLMLKKWAVVDAQGITTTVSLLGPQFGESLDDALFKVENRTLKQNQD